MVLNSVMVGFITAVTQLLSKEAVSKAVSDSVPSSFRDLNLKAFEKGFDYGLSHSEAVIARGYEDVVYAEE
jgi:2-oxoglutarate ferredoxin oxidoreductase subunit gamma